MLQCDTCTGAVTLKSAMLFPRKNFAASVVAEKIYVAGGSASSWQYDCIIDGLKIRNTENEQPCASRATGAEAHVYASSMDLYNVEEGVWLQSRAVPSGECVGTACTTGGDHLFIPASHAVELSFWMFNGQRRGGGGGFGDERTKRQSREEVVRRRWVPLSISLSVFPFFSFSFFLSSF